MLRRFLLSYTIREVQTLALMESARTSKLFPLHASGDAGLDDRASYACGLFIIKFLVL